LVQDHVPPEATPIIRLRTLLGALPRAVDGLVDLAFGDAAPAARRAARIAAGLVGTILVVAGLALAPSAFSDVSGYLPWAVAVLAAVALLAVVVASRRRTDPRPSVVPALIGLLLLVSTVPVVQAGAELIVTRTSTGDFVDRLTGNDVTLLEVQALAFGVPFAGPPRADGTPTWFYAVRDDVSDERVAFVRSAVPPGGFATRSVLARVLVDATKVSAAAAALRGHGWLTQPLVQSDGRYLAEVDAAQGGSRSIGSADDLATLAAGTLVRIELHFGGTGVAACEAADPSAAPGAACNAHDVAAGGAFLQLATDGAGRAVIVQTAYPASDVPIHVVGRQVRAEAQLASLLTLPWVDRLAGWGNVLPFAYLDHDPRLPVDQLWLAPILFLALAALLLIGRRIGYPVFVLDAGARDQEPIGSGMGPFTAVSTRVSGRLARSRGGPIDVEDAPALLRPAGPGSGPQLTVELPSGPFEIALPAGGGAMTNLDRGTVHALRRRLPALWLHWFGSDARLVFDDPESRDRAEALLASLREPPGPRRRGG
jgi:hypothetical protein